MPSSRRFARLPALLLGVFGCSLVAPTSTPPALSTAAVTAAVVPTAALPGPTRPAAPTGTRPPIPTRTVTRSPGGVKLSDAGPWLLISAANGVWAVNADGSGLTQVFAGGPFFRLGPAAPRGGHASLTTGSDPQGVHDLTFSVLGLPGGAQQVVTPLTDAGTEPGPNLQPGDAAVQASYVLGQSDWSPDGANLAFIGAQAGASAELFHYNLGTGSVTRLTDDPSQAYSPRWSPDGRYILQLGASSFGTGAGFTMDGVWAARADNSGVRALYKPDSGGEVVLGWPGPSTFAVSSFYVQCSNGRVRTFDIETGQTQSIFHGYYASLAADPATGAALVAVDRAVATCDSGSQQGLFLARPGVPPLLLDPNAGNASHLGWSPQAGIFFADSSAHWLAFTTDGKPAPLPEALNGEPVVAAGGKNWAWVDVTTDGLEANIDGAPSQLVFDGIATRPTWSPDGQTLFFFGDGRLYAAALPRLNPVAVANPLAVTEGDVVEWVK